jgi:hypothetical protein
VKIVEHGRRDDGSWFHALVRHLLGSNMKPWNEWRDCYRALLVIHSVNEFSQGEIKVADDLGRSFYETGMEEDAAVEQALKDVKRATPEALVAAELTMAKGKEAQDKRMEEFRSQLGIGPDGETNKA